MLQFSIIKKEAFKRLTSSFKFKHWMSKKIQQIDEKETVEEKLDNLMKPENILVEVKQEGKWAKQEKELEDEQGD